MGSRRAIRFAGLAVASLLACDRGDDEPVEDVGAPGCIASFALSTLSTCVQFDSGEVSCFGWNRCGELGAGAASGSRARAEPALGLTDVHTLKGGSWGFCAVSEDATGWCWGTNPFERLGSPATEPTCDQRGAFVAEPTRTLDLVGVVDIDLGSDHACAVLEDGTVGCWGSNDMGQLGGGTEDAMSSAMVPVALAPAREIDSGYAGTCALLADSTVSCWGNLPGLDLPDTPADVGLTDITQLATHGNTYYALRADGTAWAWGSNGQGQLGIGTEGDTPPDAPVHIDSLSDVVQIAAGGSHACALLGSGEVWCWGANYNSQIARPGAAASSIPIQFEGIPLAAAISAGQEHTCIVAHDGSVRCWGCNCCFQLGSGPQVQCAPDGSGSAPVVADITCPPTGDQTSYYGCAAASGHGPAGLGFGVLLALLFLLSGPATRRRAPPAAVYQRRRGGRGLRLAAGGGWRLCYTQRDQPMTTLRATSVLTRHKWIARFRLRVVEGPDAGAVVESRGVEVSVGTSEVSDLRLTDASVSRHHCVLVVADDGIRLRDLDSTNGTAINGVRVTAAYVTPPARIAVGRTTLAFEGIDREYCEALSRSDRFGDLIGQSEAMRRIFALAEKVARTDATVLIEGETGCGKGLLAEAIHEASARAGNSFTVVDCASLPAALIESELFGHEKGAFTGAEGRRIGLFESAGGGTVFLDEVGELPIELQPKLLRVVESHTVSRVGSTQRVPVDFRLIAATNRDLRSSVNRGTFRADLLYRLNGVRLVIPPLRDRREDIPLLLAHFYAQLTGVPDRQPPPELLSLAMQSDWPGNVRELRNAVERSRLDETLEEWYGDSRPGIGPTSFDPAMPFKVAKEHAMGRWEAAYLRELMALAQGNLTRAAEMVQMDRGHLRQLLRRYKLWS